MQRPLVAMWHTTASGRPSYEVFDATPELVAYVIREVVEQLGFTRALWPPIVGLDEVIGELRRDGEIIHIGWDNWSGFYVFADAVTGDASVRDVAAWLEPQLPELLRYSQPRSAAQ